MLSCSMCVSHIILDQALFCAVTLHTVLVQVKDNEGLNFLCSKAEVIDEIETTVPQWVKDRNPDWYPAFVHVLKVMLVLTDLYTAISASLLSLTTRLCNLKLSV